VSYLLSLDYDGKNIFTIKKQTEDGYQIVEVDGPCLVTVLSNANKPRYMSVRGIMEAFDKEVEVWSADKIDVDEAK
ncbi:MAG TPA: electron transfer flavoprotein subunit beta, partial [Bacteroidales bacterium]|nr:electron transfer flavoprotein subunit beta [Bacteroidales bacterium]